MNEITKSQINKGKMYPTPTNENEYVRRSFENFEMLIAINTQNNNSNRFITCAK